MFGIDTQNLGKIDLSIQINFQGIFCPFTDYSRVRAANVHSAEQLREAFLRDVNENKTRLTKKQVG
jgi:hypothetical protein